MSRIEEPFGLIWEPFEPPYRHEPFEPIRQPFEPLYRTETDHMREPFNPFEPQYEVK